MSEPFDIVDGARLGILMGSASDWPTMKKASSTLDDFGVVHECNVISAHRAPARLERYCTLAEERGLAALICAAGGAAHPENRAKA